MFGAGGEVDGLSVLLLMLVRVDAPVPLLLEQPEAKTPNTKTQHKVRSKERIG
jgi:hypothetical protein